MTEDPLNSRRPCWRAELGRRGPVAATIAAAVLAALALPAGGHAQTSDAPAAPPPQGAKLFRNQCAACHGTVAGEARIGPSLAGIAGRKAAALAGYPYSEALRRKGAGGLAWTAENLDAWLADSGAFISGSIMNFRQADPAKRAAIVSYLSELK